MRIYSTNKADALEQRHYARRALRLSRTTISATDISAHMRHFDSYVQLIVWVAEEMGEGNFQFLDKNLFTVTDGSTRGWHFELTFDLAKYALEVEGTLDYIYAVMGEKVARDYAKIYNEYAFPTGFMVYLPRVREGHKFIFSGVVGDEQVHTRIASRKWRGSGTH